MAAAKCAVSIGYAPIQQPNLTSLQPEMLGCVQQYKPAASQLLRKKELESKKKKKKKTASTGCLFSCDGMPGALPQHAQIMRVSCSNGLDSLKLLNHPDAQMLFSRQPLAADV